MKHLRDRNTAVVRKWLNKSTPENCGKLNEFLREKGFASHGVANVLCAEELGELRAQIVEKFKIK